MTPDTKPIPTEAIAVGEQLIRHDANDDSIAELAADLAMRGLLQPIGVTPTPDGRYQLLYGHRRLLAAIRLGWSTIPATIHPHPPAGIRSTALAENLMRKQLTLAEEIDAVAALAADGLSPSEIATRIGRSRSWVLTRLELPNYPPDLLEPLLEGHLTISQAQALARIPDTSARLYLTNQTRQHRLAPYQIRDLADHWTRPGGIAEVIPDPNPNHQPPTPPPQPLIKCVACGRAQPLSATVAVRVCGTGCQTAEPTPTPQPPND